MDLTSKRILVTGGHGFLGQHVIQKLKERGVNNIYAPSSKELDLRTPENCKEAVKEADVVLHLAGKIGGIAFNQKYPAELFYDNLKMGMQLIDAAYRENVEKFVIVGTACEYPASIPVPFKESGIWEGYPAKETAPYGLAKKALLVQTQTYREQYGFNAIQVIPTNLYGPKDNFGSEFNHVIPMLIERIYKAKLNKSDHVDVWGTGNATREFLYAEDAAEGIILAAEKYGKPEPLNLGTGQETSIKELAETISDIIGYKGRIAWDTSRPDGTLRRCLDSSRAYKEIGFKAKTQLRVGLEKTIAWYLAEAQPWMNS